MDDVADPPSEAHRVLEEREKRSADPYERGRCAEAGRTSCARGSRVRRSSQRSSTPPLRPFRPGAPRQLAREVRRIPAVRSRIASERAISSSSGSSGSVSYPLAPRSTRKEPVEPIPATKSAGRVVERLRGRRNRPSARREHRPMLRRTAPRVSAFVIEPPPTRIATTREPSASVVDSSNSDSVSAPRMSRSENGSASDSARAAPVRRSVDLATRRDPLARPRATPAEPRRGWQRRHPRSPSRPLRYRRRRSLPRWCGPRSRCRGRSPRSRVALRRRPENRLHRIRR